MVATFGAPDDLIPRAWISPPGQRTAARLAQASSARPMPVGCEAAHPVAEQEDLAIEQDHELLEPPDGGARLEQALAERQLDLDDARKQVRQDRRVVRDREAAGRLDRRRGGRTGGVERESIDILRLGIVGSVSKATTGPSGSGASISTRTSSASPVSPWRVRISSR